MALSYVGGTASPSASATLPAFTAGDIALVYAYRDGSNSAPTLASGWTNIASSGGSSNAARVGYRVLQTGDATTGTWTNATEVQVIVLQGQHLTAPIGGSAAGGANSNQLSYTGFTLTDTSGGSWVVGLAGHRTATDVNTKAVTGMTTRSAAVTSLGAHTAQAVSSFATSNYTTTVDASSGWRSYAVEVIAHTPKSTGTVRVSLASADQPATRDGHQVLVRARKTGGVTNDTIRVQLYEGGVARSSVLESATLTTSFADYTLAIPTADAEDIASYSDLELRLYGHSDAGGATTFEVAYLALEVPASSVTEAYGVSTSTYATTFTTYGIASAAGTTQTGIVRLSLEAGYTPAVRTGHEIAIRARKTVGGDTGTLRVQLFEGATPRTGILESSALTTSFADYSIAVPEADAETIASYANLELHFFGYSSTGSSTVYEVSEASLVLPLAGSGGNVTGQAVLSSITSASVGETVGVIYPGTNVYPRNFVTSYAASAIAAAGVTTHRLAAASLPLSLNTYTEGHIPPDREGAAVLATTTTVSTDSLHTARGAAALPSVSQVVGGNQNLINDGSFESGVVRTSGTPWILASGEVYVDSHTHAIHPSYGGYRCYSNGYSYSVGLLSSAIRVDITQPYVLAHYVQQWQQLGSVDPDGTIRLLCYDANQNLLGFVYPNEAAPGVNWDSGHAITYGSGWGRWGGRYRGAEGISGTAAGGFIAGTQYVRVELILQYTYPGPFAAGIGVVVDGVSLNQGETVMALDDADDYLYGGVSHADTAALSTTTAIAAAGEVTAPPAPPVYIPYFETMPDILAGIAFDAGPQTSYPVYDDVADCLRSVSTQRGRQFELDRVETGQVAITLSNLDGRFSPENTAGPNYGNLLPTRRVRVGLQWVSPTENLVADGSFESGRAPSNTWWAPWWLSTGVVTVDGPYADAVHPSAAGYRLYTASYTGSVGFVSWTFIPVDITQPYTLSHYVRQWQQLGVVDPNGTIRLLCYDENKTFLGFVYPNEASAGTSYDSGHAITYTGSFVRWGGTYNGQSGVSGTATGGFIAGTEWVRVDLIPQYTPTSFAQGIGVIIDAVQLVQDTTAHTWEDNKSYVAGGFAVGDIFNGYLEGYPQEFPAGGADSVVRQRAVDGFFTLSMTKLTPGTSTLWGDVSATSEWMPVVNTSLPMPEVLPFTIRIEQEAMTVTAKWPGWYFVTRDAQTATAHASGTTVYAEAVSFGSEYSDQRIRRVLEYIGLSASDYNLEPGQTLLAASENLAGQTPLEHINLATEVEGGRFFAAADGRLTFQSRHHQFKHELAPRATWGENPGELPYQDIKITHEQERLFNIVRIKSADGTLYEARDEASIADHYERVLEKDWPLADANEARSAAYYLLKRYSRMQIRIPELKVTGQVDPDVLWPYLIGLEIGQRFRVVRRPSVPFDHVSDEAIDKECIVEGIQHTLEPGRAVTTLQLSLADTTHYWRLGVAGYSELGSTTRLVY